MLRLSDAALEEPGIDFDEQLGRVADLEFAFSSEIAPHLESASDSLDPSDYFRLAQQLKEVQPIIVGMAHWSQVEAQVSLTVMTVVGLLNRQLDGELRDRWIEWRDSYLPELKELMRELRRQAAQKTQARNAEITAAIDPLLPEARRQESLSRKALLILKSTPGVTSVLNGMRTPDHVDDSIAILGWSDLENVRELLEAAG